MHKSRLRTSLGLTLALVLPIKLDRLQIALSNQRVFVPSQFPFIHNHCPPHPAVLSHVLILHERHPRRALWLKRIQWLLLLPFHVLPFRNEKICLLLFPIA